MTLNGHINFIQNLLVKRLYNLYTYTDIFECCCVVMVVPRCTMLDEIVITKKLQLCHKLGWNRSVRSNISKKLAKA